MEEATARSALISLTKASFGSAFFRQVRVLSVVSSPVAPPAAFHDITKLLSFQHAGGVRTLLTLARDQFSVMYAEVVTEETVSKVVVIVSAASGHLSAKRQQLFVNLTKRLAIVNGDCVVTAISGDDVLAVGRHARRIDAVEYA